MLLFECLLFAEMFKTSSFSELTVAAAPDSHGFFSSKVFDWDEVRRYHGDELDPCWRRNEEESFKENNLKKKGKMKVLVVFSSLRPYGL